jgi:hypothetical protein
LSKNGYQLGKSQIFWIENAVKEQQTHVKRKKTKKQTMVGKTLHRRLSNTNPTENTTQKTKD